MKKSILLLLCCAFISPVASAAVITPGDQITASYDLSGGSYAGPFDGWVVAFQIGAANPWEIGTRINLQLFDSLGNPLDTASITNPFVNPSSLGVGFTFAAPTSNLTGTLTISSVDSDFDLLLSSLQLAFRLNSDIGGTRTDAVLSNLVVSNVPIPAAAWLFGTALLGLAGFRRRRTFA